ncbi:MAG TPA: radical SAM family heme chaperone HemW [Gemmataceae bacterium]|nr:radical SAM family heme chaperone HemW [Gemmataceae bacterium]
MVNDSFGFRISDFGFPAQREPWLWPRAAYIHVPFCAHHCGYCDFAIATGQDNFIELYLDALAAELATLGEPQAVRTLFVGGGTPTHLSAAQLARLLSSLRHWLPLNADGETEFSIECNPDTLSADKIDVLADHGVTRISLGAQSFHADLLRALERAHDVEEIARAVARVRRRIDNVSLDLIFGVPGQTESQWRTDLSRALALEPDHLSTYGLTYEKGTPLWKRRQRGQVRALDEDAELALYALAIDTLEAAGFEQYEISSFARPGRRCQHNQIYWANEAYFGFGMGAARYVHGRRELNTRDLRRYIRHALSGESVTLQSEELAAEERARETMAVQLRRAEGIDRIAFQAQTGFDLDALAGAALICHIEQGFLADDAARVRLTRRGKYVADAVIERLL